MTYRQNDLLDVAGALAAASLIIGRPLTKQTIHAWICRGRLVGRDYIKLEVAKRVDQRIYIARRELHRFLKRTGVREDRRGRRSFVQGAQP